MFALIVILLLLFYFTVNVFKILLRNYNAHQFFKSRAPKLPVIPNPNIFSGHIHQITLKDKNWKIITELHKKYGPSFGFYMCDQPWIATTDVDLLKIVEIDQAHKHINRSKFGLPFDEFNRSIFQLDDDEWRQARRAISPAFTKHKIHSKEVSTDIKLIIGRLQKSLEAKLDKAELETGSRVLELDVHNTFQRYTLSVVFLLTYKRDHVIDFDTKDDYWVNMMERGARCMTNRFVCLSVMFPFIRPFIAFLIQFHKIGRIKFKIMEYITEATDIHRMALEQHRKMQRKLSLATGAKERSFSELSRQGNYQRRMVDTAIEAFLDKKIKYEDFMGSMLFMLLAGFETTADTLTCLVWQLATNPDIQEKLRTTILNEGIDADYVIWCIFEVIRWHPAVPLGTGRILTQDLTVNGQFYPKGAFIMPSTYSIHHNSDIWPEADRFNPERWRKASSFHPAAFMGFGLGPRNCLGGKLAIYEVKLMLEMLLKSYRIEKYIETTSHYEFSSPGLVFTLLDQPIKVRLISLSGIHKT